jgi:hypothetical protein
MLLPFHHHNDGAAFYQDELKTVFKRQSHAEKERSLFRSLPPGG